MSIHLHGLIKSYGALEVLKGVDLEVPLGQIIGYIGPNGAGKTTTVKILVGMLDDFGGEAAVCGLDVRANALDVKRRIGYVPETAVFYDPLTPRQYLGFLGQIHAMSESETERRGSSLLEMLGLAADMDSPLATFSKGMRQKVLLAAALLHNPEVLFLDEPLSGLDANSVILVKEIIGGLAERGKTIFYCSHVMDVVERLCHRIVILDDGRIVADGSFEELQSQSTGASLERIFTELTSAGGQEAVARRFIDALDDQAGS